ncbi:MAG: thiamine-monophosphate kinase [Sphingomonas bacterium]|uniref:thiamine-phosphate kinase n=1 Tax=Sphingomonas bacterium TaxID=1895847 RepID=UPI00260416A7|nr:thiamine-phosphate kinase [Sphingomonas bacterium]MDB5706376.1 thiamine-monophosphate kinase [Sphingomonas bacterium]
MTESEFLAALRTLPLHPAARGLRDDTALLDVTGPLVLTTDTMVEGVHFLATDPAEDIAWKLGAVNLSDLAAKGALPLGIMLNYTLAGDDAWDAAFIAGLRQLDCNLIGGDTVSLPAGAPRVLTLTAIGVDAAAPPRSGARTGDHLYVTGTIGDAGAGLAIAQGAWGPGELLAAYRRPMPRTGDGRALAPHVHAMMDVSDGLLLDTARMAEASGLAVTIDLAAVPLSDAYRRFAGDTRDTRLAAATAGDDYQLLFAAPAGFALPVPATRVGSFAAGTGLTLHDGADPVPLPPRLGFEHAA